MEPLILIEPLTLMKPLAPMGPFALLKPLALLETLASVLYLRDQLIETGSIFDGLNLSSAAPNTADMQELPE
jgi:hypothetical protein